MEKPEPVTWQAMIGRNAAVTDRWGRSTDSVDRARAGPGGPDVGPVWAEPEHMSAPRSATWRARAAIGLTPTGVAHGGQRVAGPRTAGTVRSGLRPLPLSLPLAYGARGAPGYGGARPGAPPCKPVQNSAFHSPVWCGTAYTRSEYTRSASTPIFTTVVIDSGIFTSVVMDSPGMVAIRRANCFDNNGLADRCNSSSTPRMAFFGVMLILFSQSQIPADFDQIWWLSIVAAVMSFTYYKIAFAYSYSYSYSKILIEIQVS